MYNGIINIYKEQGYTSFDVVALLRKILHQKKIGHTGTLDPMAEGVLVVCLGNATKLCEILTADTKEYETVLKLGECSDTDDCTGKISVRSGFEIPTEEAIRKTVMSYLGTYEQKVPEYAAVKVNGRKLYEYAREGLDVPEVYKEITVYSLDILEIDYPYVRINVVCSKGTYIRSLCRDIGEALGTGGLMESLLRRQTGGFKLSESKKLDEVRSLSEEGRLDEIVLPIEALIGDWPAADISEKGIKYLTNGNKLLSDDLLFRSSADEKKAMEGMIFRVYFDDKLYALYKYDDDKKAFLNYKMLSRVEE